MSNMMLLNHSILWLALIFSVIEWAQGDLLQEFKDEFSDKSKRKEVEGKLLKLSSSEKKNLCHTITNKLITGQISNPIKVHGTNFEIRAILCGNDYYVPSTKGHYYQISRLNNQIQPSVQQSGIGDDFMSSFAKESENFLGSFKFELDRLQSTFDRNKNVLGRRQ